MRSALQRLESGSAAWFSRPRRTAAVLIALGVITAALALHGMLNPLHTDYLAMLTGASVLQHGGCLYCLPTQYAAQHALLHTGGPTFDAFLEPPLVAEAYRPLLPLSPTAGFAAALAVSVVLVGAAAWLARRVTGVDDAALLGLAFLATPAAWLYALGQTDAPVIFALAGALWLRSRGRPWLAGAAVAVACVKPQTAILAIPLLGLAGEWRMLLGSLVSGAGLLGLSAVLAGPAAAGQWLSLAAATGPDLATGMGLPSLAAWAAGPELAALTAVVVAVGGLAVAWRERGSLLREPDLVLSFGVLLSVLAAPHVYPYDLIVLAIPLLALGRRNLGAALLCGVLLSGGHLVDSLFVWSGPHVETLVVAWMLVRLRQLARYSADATALSAQRSVVSESCAGVVSAFTR